ncbi:MAG: hypothetical protein NC489_43000, partial [Ruminococcus flavefaciens]|nr:hypothetical protein [Ruminococcus flavefaciens]
MRVKTNFWLTVGLLVILLCLTSVLVIVMQEPPKANAATNTSAVYKVNGRQELLDGTPTSIASPDDYFTITMESLNASGTGTMQNFSTINWTYVKFKVQAINVLEHTSFRLERDGIKIVEKELSGNEDMTLFTGSVFDGEYVMTYQMNYGRKLNYRGMLYRFRFTVDISAPQFTIESGGGNIASGSNTAKNITYSATDTHF